MMSGEIFCQAVLVGLTADMSYRKSFSLVSAVLLLMTLPIYWMVVETKEVEKLEQEAAQISKWTKVKEMTNLVIAECRAQAKYPLCLFASMVNAPIVPLLSLIGILWIASFIEDGFVIDDVDAKEIYKSAVIVAMIASMCCLPIFALISDRLNPLWTTPLSFLVRAFFAGSVRFVENPKSWLTTGLFTGLVVSSAAQSIILTAWYNRKMNKEIRGSMTNVRAIVSISG